MNSFNSRILKEIEDKQSHLCVGLDINPENFDNANPSIDDLKNHTYKVIDATRDIAVAYKPNLAFFERWGSKGFQWLEETMEYIGSDVITVGDAKRGDIGNTAKQYAMSLFDHFGFDSVTLSPFLGLDSIKPFVDNLLNHDQFCVCADFTDYCDAQDRVSSAWQDWKNWQRMSLINVARSGFFSSDRSIKDYCAKIWSM